LNTNIVLSPLFSRLWSLIGPLAREYDTYASYELLDAAPASRHQVDMAMDGLSCDLAVLDADVESLHARVLPLDCLLLLLEESVAGVELRLA
jgi:hypothetical protein